MDRVRRTLPRQETTPSSSRIVWIERLFFLAFLIVLSRLAYWQIWKHGELSQTASAQYESWRKIETKRGSILDANGGVFATNEERYTLFAEPPVVSEPPQTIAEKLIPILEKGFEPTALQASDEAWWIVKRDETRKQVVSDLSDRARRWVPLAHRLSREQKSAIEALKLRGLGFDAHSYRSYPDASLSAQLLGFVGKTDQGEDQGYFGLEGFYDLELQGREGRVEEQKTARGLPIAFSKEKKLNEQSGRDLILSIQKPLQYQVEQELLAGIERYGAQSGQVIVMEPKTGAILAMASYPNYNPQRFQDFDPKFYRNPIVSDLYEPGSTLKVLTVAAGIESGAITPETTCDNCAGPRTISGFPVRTWNEEYHPNITMKDALAKSDNTAMVFIEEKLGKEKWLEWLRAFGLNDKTGVDLQGEAKFEFRDDKEWRAIDTATSSFGQGIAVTSLNLVRGVASIANGGKLMQPSVVKAVRDGTEIIEVKPQVLAQVFSPETAKTVTEMMVYSAQAGDSKWTTSRDVNVAGKTGTAQISEGGKYLEDKTIASFVGFAPAEDPKFVMLVVLREPTTSPWGSETAAPLWYKIMRHIL
jgi:stage V sporulation protein D (sporulation-specific penicillin-binding protein)